MYVIQSLDVGGSQLAHEPRHSGIMILIDLAIWRGNPPSFVHYWVRRGKMIGLRRTHQSHASATLDETHVRETNVQLNSTQLTPAT